MIVVVFEVWPKPGRADAYFEKATALRPLLEAMDGFISVERFESVSEPGKFLSLSFWRDEAAAVAWRNQAEHKLAQATGRDELFSNFRISVADVQRAYDMAGNIGEDMSAGA